MKHKDQMCRLCQCASNLAQVFRRGFQQQALKCLAGGILCLTPFVHSAEPPFTDEEILENTVVKLPIDRISRFVDEFDQASVKWGRFATHDPRTANLMRDARKTPEQKNQHALAILAITNPEAYRNALAETKSQEKPKTPAQQRKEDEERAEAFNGMLNPRAGAAESERKKTPKQRRREAVSAYAILHAVEFNSRVERHKSPALKEKEADAILALSQPRVFRELRIRLKKTGSTQPSKNSQGKPADPASSQPQNRGVEKGSAQGGGR